MKIKLGTLILLLTTIGCASTPVAVDLPTVTDNPRQFKNKRVEIRGTVLENFPPRGDEYRTWSFFIGSADDSRIMVSEEGFNPSTIEKAYRLVEEARTNGDEITITGTVRVGPYREFESGMEVELDSVRYRGIIINTDRGPYVGDYYPYHYYHYYRPPFWHYRYYPYYHYHPYGYYYWP